MATALRNERVARLNTGTVAVPVWTLMGDGFNTVDEAKNPSIQESIYVSDVNASKSLTSYSPEFAFDGDVITDDVAVLYLLNIADTNATGEDAESEVLVYNTFDIVTGTVDAIKYPVVVAMDTPGDGAGGEKLHFAGTLHGNGDAVTGTYTVATKAFVADVS